MAPTSIPIRLYSDRAKKFVSPQGRPTTVRKLKEASNVGLNIFRDYCANSSIHGFKYFVGANRTRAEKIWWATMCILSIYGCGSLIQTVFDKWRRDPVVVTFAEKPTPIYDIPFPAVTICPITKVKSSVLNFTAVYKSVVDGSGNITEEEYDRFLAMIQVCDFSFNQFLPNQHFDDNLVHVLQDMALSFDDLFLRCIWRNKYTSCENLFAKTLTERGICYTFNGLSEDVILRKEEFHRDFDHLSEKKSSKNWSMEQGYKPNLGLDVYPRRVVSAGSSAGLIVLLKSDLQDMDYLCGNSFQGFQAQIHTPNQIPQISSQSIRVPMNQALTVRIDPFLITTSKNVKSYSAQKRRCYYPQERYLRFFRIYTKRNCELECLANFTLHMCGCVQYSMPRPPSVHICGIERLECCEQAESILQEQGLGSVDNSSRMLLQSCYCLPACIFLEYKTEMSQAHFDWQRLTNTIHLFEREMNHSEMSSISIYYKEAQFISIKRNQLFGLNDFIANCGGILGLFMGVSLLSIVEILYYFTMKPLINHFMTKYRKNHKIAAVEPYVPGGTYSTTFNRFLRDVA
ncbi:pickpocket protein 28-like [Anopheles stephensi]|uniref:pickpocket protein 28-like n=1 Tax=Anopheles stephensi TaxID=30069 RepID=UPI001658C252|nr:pickpocket protein 28-like [Anopheles stephensi]